MKLIGLHHYYANFMDSNDRWNQFNKEQDRLEVLTFKIFNHTSDGYIATLTGNKIIVVQNNSGTVNIQSGKTINQTGDIFF